MSLPTPRAVDVLWFVVMQAPMNFTNSLSYGYALVHGNIGPYEEGSPLSFYPKDLSTFPSLKTKTSHTHARNTYPSTRLCMCADSYIMGSVEKSQRTRWRVGFLLPPESYSIISEPPCPHPSFYKAVLLL